MTKLPRVGPEEMTGGWYGVSHVVWVRCPECLVSSRLHAHDVDARGRVSPTWSCLQCDFHARLMLEGWPDDS